MVLSHPEAIPRRPHQQSSQLGQLHLSSSARLIGLQIGGASEGEGCDICVNEPSFIPAEISTTERAEHRQQPSISDMATPAKRTFTYKTVGKLELPFDLYLPENASKSPVMLWFHGGGLLQGHRSGLSPHLLRAVNKYNLAFISADYRLAPQVGVKEIYEDVRDCVKFIREQLPSKSGLQDAIDANRLAVSGGSAGGYLAYLAGLYVEPKPKVILPIYPITDPLGQFFTTPQHPAFGRPEPEIAPLKPFIDESTEVVANNAPDSPRSRMYDYMLMGANLAALLKVEGTDKTWRVPKMIYERGLPPTYVVHGDIDCAVGVEQADEAVGVAVGHGIETVYERMHNVDHLFDKDEKVELEKMYEFALKHL